MSTSAGGGYLTPSRPWLQTAHRSPPSHCRYAFLNLPPNSLSLKDGAAQIGFLRDEFAGMEPRCRAAAGDSTAFDQIEQRDLFDRAPEFKRAHPCPCPTPAPTPTPTPTPLSLTRWADGHVCLLGDAVHPMQPTLGQGGGMAIEDALVLGQERRTPSCSRASPIPRLIIRPSIRLFEQELRRDVLMRGGPAVPLALGRYQQNRILRVAAVQGISRSASAFLFQYNHPTTIDLLAEGGPTARAECSRVHLTHPVPTCRYASALHVHLARISHASQVSNFYSRSLIVRTMQGFLQKVAFPLVYEFLFSFPGSLRPHSRWLTPRPQTGASHLHMGLSLSLHICGSPAALGPKPQDAVSPVPTNRNLFSATESAEGALFNPNFSLKEWLNMYW